MHAVNDPGPQISSNHHQAIYFACPSWIIGISKRSQKWMAWNLLSSQAPRRTPRAHAISLPAQQRVLLRTSPWSAQPCTGHPRSVGPRGKPPGEITGAPVVPGFFCHKGFNWIKLWQHVDIRLVHELGIHHMVQKGGRVDHAITRGRCSTFQDTINHHRIIHTWHWLTVTYHFAV